MFCEICNKKLFFIGYKKYAIKVCSIECLGKYIKTLPMIPRKANPFNIYVNSLFNGFKSDLEEEVAYNLSKQGIKFYYEPYIFQYNSIIYIPDFYLPEKNLFLEIKGRHKLNIKKFLLFASMCDNLKIFIFKNKIK